ncbi:MFS transporter [Candidatus Bathyarchaeota archaeon]|nr:MFS transporter [Candidatus Bathyarchaeota archaeon]
MRGNLLIFTIGDSLRQLSMFITFPFFSLYVQALGGSMVEIGIVNSLRPLTALFVYPIAGYLAHRYSRIKVIAATIYLTAPFWLIYVFARDWRGLALGNLMLGLMTFYFPAANSLMADSIPPDKRGLAYSLWWAIPSAVGILSPYIGGYLTTRYGVVPAMRFLYVLTFVVSITNGTMNLKFMKEPPREKREEGNPGVLRMLVDSYRDMLAILAWLPRGLKAFAVMLVLGFFFNNMMASYWVIYSVEALGMTKLQWGTVLLIAAVVNVVLLLPAGMIVDRIGTKRTLTAALAAAAIPLLLFPFSRGFWDVTLIFVALTTANSVLTSGAPALMAQMVPSEMRGRVMAALGQGMLVINLRGSAGGGPGMGAVLAIPSILGALVGGYVYEYSPMLPWLMMGAAMLLSALINAFLVSVPESRTRMGPG